MCQEVLATMHPKCFYTNACSMRNEQEVPKAVAQFQRFDIIVVSETWWDEPCDWSALLDTCTLFKWGRQGRRGGRVALDGIEE